MMRLAMILVAMAVMTTLGGCATTPDEQEKVSTMPWNRPQTWEGSGALGGFRPPGTY